MGARYNIGNVMPTSQEGGKAWYRSVRIRNCDECGEPMAFDPDGEGGLEFWCQNCGWEFDRDVTRDDISGRRDWLERATTLSDREAEVVAFKESGATHAQIADEMDIEKGTVDSHAHRARVKYNMASKTERELAEHFE